MIKFYREGSSLQADAIEEEFKDMLLGYDRVVINPQEAFQLFGKEHSLPVITNNEKVVSGDEISGYLEELRMLMRDWQRFQGDSCYVDDDGEVC